MLNQTEILQEILNWTRVGFYSEVKQMLTDVLDADNKRIAYQMSDGLKSLEAIKSAAGIGSDSLTALHQQCVSLGLMTVTEDSKRKRLFDLTNFGLMPVTDISKDSKKDKK